MTRHGRAQCGARPVQVFCGPKKEVCPTSGRLHWQGYIELKDKARLGKVKEVLGCPSAHLEMRRGTSGRGYSLLPEGGDSGGAS